MIGDRRGGYLPAIEIAPEVEQGPIRRALESIRQAFEKLESRGRTYEVHEPFYVAVNGDPSNVFLDSFPVLRPARDVELDMAYWTPFVATTAAVWSLALDRYGSDGGSPVLRMAHIDGSLASGPLFVVRRPIQFPKQTNANQRIKAGDVLTLKITKTDDVVDPFPRGLLSLYLREVG